PPIALSAFVCVGATCTFALASVMHGGPQLTFGADGWAWVVAIAIVSTVAAILCFFAGLARVGPSAASILSTLEPVVTVALAATAFGESLGAVQVVGGALVLGAVLVMQWPARRDGRIGSRGNETGAAQPRRDSRRNKSDWIHVELASHDTAEHRVGEHPGEVDRAGELTQRGTHDDPSPWCCSSKMPEQFPRRNPTGRMPSYSVRTPMTLGCGSD